MPADMVLRATLRRVNFFIRKPAETVDNRAAKAA